MGADSLLHPHHLPTTRWIKGGDTNAADLSVNVHWHYRLVSTNVAEIDLVDTVKGKGEAFFGLLGQGQDVDRARIDAIEQPSEDLRGQGLELGLG